MERDRSHQQQRRYLWKNQRKYWEMTRERVRILKIEIVTRNAKYRVLKDCSA